ncbi:hypothetical protein [Streptomyces flaveolus]|uniref:hypothetical protein n=1 Tax=Streptomyces flaveolus TaxID=67297 RepID=UPI0036F5D622
MTTKTRRLESSAVNAELVESLLDSSEAPSGAPLHAESYSTLLVRLLSPSEPKDPKGPQRP